MHATGRHRQNRGRHGSSAARGAPMYYGWSHDEARMQMMALPDYLDSFRLGYERALEDLQGQFADVTQSFMPAAYAPTGQRHIGRHGPSHHDHDHDHEHHCGCSDHDCGCHDHRGHRGRDCGCGRHDDCRCDCCIVDADYVIYARCFERRVVPIQVENDTRKVREDVNLEVSDVRSSGGRVLPWSVSVRPRSPLTLEPCSTTEIDLLVEIECGDKDQDTEPQVDRKAAGQKAAAAKDSADGEASSRFARDEPADVDGCEVGYVTIRVGGCIIRPIVVAIAVLSRDCGAYHAGCSCSDCC